MNIIERFANWLMRGSREEAPPRETLQERLAKQRVDRNLAEKVAPTPDEIASQSVVENVAGETLPAYDKPKKRTSKPKPKAEVATAKPRTRKPKSQPS